VHDAFQCSEAGTPSAVIVTAPFEKLAMMTAEKLGQRQLPIGVIEHPVFTRDQEWMDRAADGLVDFLVASVFDRS
jgi:hypothetical protein